MPKEAGITVKKAMEARGTCFFVFADKKKIGRTKTKADVPVVVAKYQLKTKRAEPGEDKGEDEGDDQDERKKKRKPNTCLPQVNQR